MMAKPPVTKPPARRQSMRPLAELVNGALGDALAKRGFAGSDIVLNWSEIVGEALGSRSEPIRVQWPARRPGFEINAQAAILHIRVESAFALELQHRAPTVIERVNGYFGWACIGKLRLEQGPVGRNRVKKRDILPPSPEALIRAGEAAAGVQDEALKAALVRLGAAVMDRAAQPAQPARPAAKSGPRR
ncbi:MAG: DUF721 domain-containing protein [Beijerinckiaceae bacterium]